MRFLKAGGLEHAVTYSVHAGTIWLCRAIRKLFNMGVRRGDVVHSILKHLAKGSCAFSSLISITVQQHTPQHDC